MKIYSIAFTERGRAVQNVMEELLLADNNEVSGFFKNVRGFTKEAFEAADAVIYIGAIGIAVRSVAPYVQAKDKDPAVIVIDELGKFVIPILSGHIGGANKLSEYLAQKLVAIPVITTATDINGKLAVDSWAVENGMRVMNTSAIKYVSSDILEDRPVRLSLDENTEFLKLKLKKLSTQYDKFLQADGQIARDEGEARDQADSTKIEEELSFSEVRITKHIGLEKASKIEKDSRTLYLYPKDVFVGMGCRRDKDPAEVEAFLLDTLKTCDIDLESVSCISSIDLKQDEAAFKYIGNKYDLKLKFYSAEQLEVAQKYTAYQFPESELVKHTTGVGNVCERAAILSAYENLKEDEAAKLVFKQHKLSRNGITISIVSYE